MSGIVGKKKSQSQSFQNVKVVVRVRPLNKNEVEQNVKNIIKVLTQREMLLKDKKYTFDRIFKPNSTQIEVYSYVVAPLIQDVVAGYNCTVFAYGQTGSGKTFTMTGEKCSILGNWKEDDEAGVIPRAAFHIFEELNKLSRAETMVKVSFIELYNEEIRDLLSEDEGTLNLYSDTKGGLFIQGMREVSVYDSEDICKMVQRGIVKRQIAPTLMNHQSSRSHTVFTISVNISETTMAGDDILKSGKINLVDLAGSENIARSGCKDLRAMELANINRSLLTLGRVIHALADKAQKHIPYRDSKLTRILQDSLGGHTKTVIIATVSPAHTSQEETASTLDYATRARDIKNAPIVNEKMTKHEMIDGLVKEIDRLQKDLDAARTGTGFYVNKENYQKLLDAIMAVTGEQISAEELESKKAERIQNLEEIMRLKKQQFDDTIKQCKKHQEELESVRIAIKQKDAILEQEKYLCKWYETQTNEKFSENQTLFNVTNMLNSEKEILLAKLENQFTINAANETSTQNAISKALSVTETFQRDAEDNLIFLRNLQLECKEDGNNRKTDLEKYSKHFKDVKNNTIHTDLFKSIAVKDTLHAHIGNQQEIIEGKLLSLEQTLLNCDQQVKMSYLMISDMACTYRDKFEKSLENLDTIMKNDVSCQTDDSSEYVRQLTVAEEQIQQNLVRQENHLRELDITREIVKSEINSSNLVLNTLRTLKNSIKQKTETRLKEMENRMAELREEALHSIQEFSDKCNRNQELQIITGEEIKDIMDSLKIFMSKINSFTISVESSFKTASEEVRNYAINSVLRIYSEIENSLDRTLSSCIERSSTMIETTEGFIESFNSFIENMKSILINEILKKNQKVRHIGDTPVKNSLEIPNRIKEFTPREVLLQKFAQALANSSENLIKVSSESDAFDEPGTSTAIKRRRNN